MDNNSPLGHAARVLSFVCLFVLAADGTSRAAGAGEPTVKPPVLQRVVLSGDTTFLFAFDVPRWPAFPNLIELRTGPSTEAVTTKTYVGPHFFSGLPPQSADIPLRWNLGNRAMFVATKWVPAPHQPDSPSLLRFPLEALVEQPDPLPGRAYTGSCIDPAKVPKDMKLPDRPLKGPYSSFPQMALAKQGFHRGWADGSNRIGDGAKVMHYDLRAVDDVHLELFLTTDGVLFKWLVDNRSIKLIQDYKFPVEGPFLVFNQGASLVVERNGRWCILASLDLADPVIRPLVDRVKGKPLILIEDKTADTAFFLHDDLLYNENGTRVFQVDTNADETTQLTSAATFVRSKRAK